MMETRITKAFGMTTPMVSAGMAFVARPELAAAVSNAGAMGFLAAEMNPPHEVADLVRATGQLTSRPFGVEFMTPYFTQWHLEACIGDPVAVVTFYWGIPKREWVERLQEAGCQVWVKASTLEEAREVERGGADAVVVDSPEGGPEYVADRLLKLLLKVADAVEIPVIASAGGVDGTGLLVALALGASAVRCGTIFLSAEEADADASYGRSMAESAIDATLRVNLLTREWPERPAAMLTRNVVCDWLRGQREMKARHGTGVAVTSRVLRLEGLLEKLSGPIGAAPGGSPSTEPTVVSIQPAARILTGITIQAQRIAEKEADLCAVA